MKTDYMSDPEFIRVTRQLIAEGVKEFEREIAPYPFVVPGQYPDYLEDPDGCLEYMGRAEAWLKENIKKGYIAFPGTAIGKHAQCCRNVYFKHERDAVYFKLGCSY